MPRPSENLVENTACEEFAAVGASFKLGSELDDAGERSDSSRPLLEGRLMTALHKLNPHLPHSEVEQVARTLGRPPLPTLVQNNRWFHEQLTTGVEVSYRNAATGETRGGRARLVDFDDRGSTRDLMRRCAIQRTRG